MISLTPKAESARHLKVVTGLLLRDHVGCGAAAFLDVFLQMRPCQGPARA